MEIHLNLERPEYAKEVRFGGNIRVEYDDATGRTTYLTGKL